MQKLLIHFIQKNYSYNEDNTSGAKTLFLDLNLSVSNNLISTNFDIVDVSVLDGDVLRATSYGVSISQLIRFARASSQFLILIIETKF